MPVVSVSWSMKKKYLHNWSRGEVGDFEELQKDATREAERGKGYIEAKDERRRETKRIFGSFEGTLKKKGDAKSTKNRNRVLSREKKGVWCVENY